jgi:uncharacterized membrane protein YgcG
MAGRRNGFRARLVAVSLVLALSALCVAASGAAGMRSEKISRHLCKTVHGGKFVAIPGFPGEKIDRRLIPDIRWMKRRFDIFITDGYSNDPVHAQSGEHPIGLATDIVPNAAKGGTWNEIGDLAHLAEPQQNAPIMPWRWVGWNGDAGHGRGNHLHLSWSHSPTEPGHPARVVYTRRCPGSGGGDEPSGDHHRHHRHSDSGGTSTGSGGGGSGDGGGGSNGGTGVGGGGGGASPKIGNLAPVVAEDQ